MGKLSKLILNEKVSRRITRAGGLGKGPVRKTGSQVLGDGSIVEVGKTKDEIELDKIKAENDKLNKKLKDQANKEKKAVEYQKILDSNKKRQDEYNKNKLQVKKYKETKPEEKPPTQSSGLVNMAVKSLRY